MQKFVASTPDAEIIGRALAPLDNPALREKFPEQLQKYGLANIDLNKWYPQQSLLSFHKEILQGPTASSLMVSIGMKIADNFPFPPDSSLEQALQLFSDLHIRIHRNTSDEDRFRVRLEGERHFVITNDSPFPDDLVYGYLYSLMSRFAPPDSKPVLRYRDLERLNTDQSMDFDLTW